MDADLRRRIAELELRGGPEVISEELHAAVNDLVSRPGWNSEYTPERHEIILRAARTEFAAMNA